MYLKVLIFLFLYVLSIKNLFSYNDSINPYVTIHLNYRKIGSFEYSSGKESQIFTKNNLFSASVLFHKQISEIKSVKLISSFGINYRVVKTKYLANSHKISSFSNDFKANNKFAGLQFGLLFEKDLYKTNKSLLKIGIGLTGIGTLFNTTGSVSSITKSKISSGNDTITLKFNKNRDFLCNYLFQISFIPNINKKNLIFGIRYIFWNESSDLKMAYDVREAKNTGSDSYSGYFYDNKNQIELFIGKLF